MKNKIKVLELGKTVAVVQLPEYASPYWQGICKIGSIELNGTYCCCYSNVIIFEGVAGPGCKCDGCAQDECENLSCQFCPARTLGQTERIYFPAGSTIKEGLK